jgi:hypothetical protein
MGKGGENLEILKSRKVSLEELSHHRTPQDGTIFIFVNNIASIRNFVIDL